MIVEIKVPSPGESISEVEIAGWLVENGDYVEKDQEVAEVESDKATLPLIAEEAGKIRIIAGIGETIKVGEVVCSIDTSAKAPAGKKKEEPATAPVVDKPKEVTASKEVPAAKVSEQERAVPKEAPAAKVSEQNSTESSEKVKVSPVAAKMMAENNLSVEDILSGLKRITKKEVQMVVDGTGSQQLSTTPKVASRTENRKRMSSLRRKLAERLVAVKNETAMLTTFNECDMSEVMALRKKFQPAFVEKHGVKLGFMSFFVKAVTEALLAFPNVNSRIDGEDMLSPEYCDIGIAVQTEKGLMVPVIRNAESLSLAEIEATILDLAGKARSARISLDDMSGGSFTITNGGVFGSMLSTPILNPPQSAILGMHNIQERPVAKDGQVIIRPMMYIALSYDHRLIDGSDSVSFLVKIKELIENPVHMMFGGKDPEKLLLEL
ncbi:2-oxoglutarate dehydrogenase complex dihydrolipoyllysine-residue succinyltransferase [Bacteroidota bacterium]